MHTCVVRFVYSFITLVYNQTVCCRWRVVTVLTTEHTLHIRRRKIECVLNVIHAWTKTQILKKVSALRLRIELHPPTIDDFTFEVWRNFSACTDRSATPTGGQKLYAFYSEILNCGIEEKSEPYDSDGTIGTAKPTQAINHIWLWRIIALNWLDWLNKIGKTSCFCPPVGMANL